MPKKHNLQFSSENITFAKETEAGALPTFRMVAYTGNTVKQFWSDTPLLVDLPTMRLPAKAMAILFSHNSSQPIGHTTSITNTGSEIIIEGVISCESEAAKNIIASGRNGFPWQASIGCEIGSETKIAAGKTYTMNGRTYTAPLTVCKDCELYESSFVVFGADGDTETTITNNRKDRTMFIDEDQVSDDAAQTVAASTEPANLEVVAEPVKATAPAKVSADEIEAQRFERIEAVKLVAAKYPAIAADAIRNGWDAEKTELVCRRADDKRSERPKPSAVYQGAVAPKREEVIAASALMTLGWQESQTAAHFSQDVMHEVSAATNRGYTLSRIVAECVREQSRNSGVHIPSAEGIHGEGLYQHYVNAQRSLMASGTSGFSTISLPGILSNVVNKTLLDAYQRTPSVIRTIASRGSSNDFKPSFSYRLYLEGGQVKKVPSTGKIESTTLQEEQRQRGIDTVGEMITLTRKMLIDDDLNALARIPAEFGYKVADTIEVEGWKLLRDNLSTLFSTSNTKSMRANRHALNLDDAGLEKSVQLMAEQINPNGTPISLLGKYLLVPPALWKAAANLTASMLMNQAPSTAVPSNNIWTGMFSILTSPYLGTAQGGSDKGWYLLADPARLALINLSFLGGREVPIVENSASSFDTLGVQFRIYHDFGFNLEEARAGVYSTGT